MISIDKFPCMYANSLLTLMQLLIKVILNMYMVSYSDIDLD